MMAIAFALGLAGGPSVAAVAVEVTVRTAALAQPPPPVVAVRATGESGAQQEQRCPLGEPCILSLAPGQRWRFEVIESDFWSAPQTLVPAAGTTIGVTLEVWHAGRVGGTLVVAEGEEGAPASMALRATAAGEPVAGTLPASLEISCPVVDGRFDCRVPAGTWDVRLRARGFVSFYRWNLAVAKGKRVDLGGLRLRRGASLVGKVEAFDGRDIHEKTRLMLAPQDLGRNQGGAEAARGRLRVELAGLGPDGFFHFEGLPAGTFALAVSHPSYAPAMVFPLELAENAETELRRAVVLEEPLTLRVRIVPARTPDEADWRVELSRHGLHPDNWLPAAPSRSSVAGAIEWGRLPPGAYTVDVYDPAGSRWAHQRVELAAGSTDHEVRVKRVVVSGRVRAGGPPVAGSLVFGGLWGQVRILAESGEDGRFVAVLPRSGAWQVAVTVSEDAGFVRDGIPIEVPEPAADRAPVEVDINLPEGEVSGIVLSSSGTGVASATVHASHPEAGPGATARGGTGSDGRFRLRGLSPGPLWLWATAGNDKSEQLLVVVQESRATGAVQLRLQERRRLEGRVMGPAGPVVAAQVVVIPIGSIHKQEASTNPDGSFSVEVPAAARQFTLLVMASGQALSWAGYTSDRNQPLLVALDSGGGSVRLRFSSRDHTVPEGYYTPVLVRDGSPVWMGLLYRWLAAHGLPFGELESRGLPNMPSGSYSPCLLPPEALAGVIQGVVSGRYCASGFLPRGGELDLAFPAPTRPSEGDRISRPGPGR